MLLDNPTIIVIFVIIALLAIAAFAFGKNAIFKMFGVTFETKDREAPPGETVVGENVEVEQGGRIDKMTGIDAAGGQVPMSGNVSVGKGMKVAGQVGEMAGRKGGPGTGSGDAGR